LGEAASVSVKLSPAAILADGKSQTEAMIEINDSEGTGLPEQEVEVTSSDPAQRIGEVTDNEDGTYSAKLTASTIPGTATITATDLSAASKLSGSASLTERTLTAPSGPPPLGLPPPSVSFSQKPAHRGGNRRPRFAFVASVPSATFTCKLDRSTYKPCSSPLKLPKLSFGAHSFSVRATDAAGIGNPATWNFRVLRHKRRHSRRHQHDVSRLG
jgi:hypothetical protein